MLSFQCVVTMKMLRYSMFLFPSVSATWPVPRAQSASQPRRARFKPGGWRLPCEQVRDSPADLLGLQPLGVLYTAPSCEADTSPAP